MFLDEFGFFEVVKAAISSISLSYFLEWRLFSAFWAYPFTDFLKMFIVIIFSTDIMRQTNVISDTVALISTFKTFVYFEFHTNLLNFFIDELAFVFFIYTSSETDSANYLSNWRD